MENLIKQERPAAPPPATTDQILAERNRTHGEFDENARISQALKLTLRDANGYAHLSMVQREALDMICLKISRIVSANPNVADHWTDIAGYARLAEVRVK